MRIVAFRFFASFLRPAANTMPFFQTEGFKRYPESACARPIAEEKKPSLFMPQV